MIEIGVSIVFVCFVFSALYHLFASKGKSVSEAKWDLLALVFAAIGAFLTLIGVHN